MGMTINLDKAKTIAHDKRRAVRNEKFKPLDIEATVPSLAEQAEAQREVIRATDSELQVSIDAALDADELVTVVKTLEV